MAKLALQLLRQFSIKDVIFVVSITFKCTLDNVESALIGSMADDTYSGEVWLDVPFAQADKRSSYLKKIVLTNDRTGHTITVEGNNQPLDITMKDITG